MDKKQRNTLLKISIRLIIIVVAVVICVKRWHVWFGNPEEPAYTIENKISRVLLTMGEDENSRYVTWICDSVSHPSWLDYYLNDDSTLVTLNAKSETFRSRSGKTCFYSALIEDVAKEGVYHYRIRTDNDTTAWMTFQKSAEKDYSFLYFGDVQDEMDGGFDSLLPSVMRRNSDARLLLFGGDLIERPMDQYWNVVFSALDTFATKYPIVTIPGNHEYLKAVPRKLEERFPLTFYYFQKSYKENGENALYTFQEGDVRFYLLDSNKDFWKFFAQRDWLKAELSKSTAKWNVVVLHHPLYSVKGKLNNLMPRLFFNGLVEDYNVDLVLQGHEHVYARFNVEQDEDGNMTSPLRLVSYSSKKDYAMEFVGDVAKWGTANRYYQRFSIHGDSLIMETYGSENQLYDKIIIEKKNGKRHFTDEGKNIPQRIYVSDWFKQSKSAKKVKAFEKNVEQWKKSHPNELLEQ